MDLFKKQKATLSDEERVREAYSILQKYKSGKAATESRIIANERIWRMKQYENTDTIPTPWLFNSIINKHADAMDNLPDICCLPRENGDIPAAELLSDVLPVILEQNNFERTYSDCWYDKLKYGTACYGVFWDPTLDGGMGNIDIRRIDMLNLFWEPGISDLQASDNIFHVELLSNSILMKKYPSLADSMGSEYFETSKYIYDENIDTTDKSCVIDRYYKKVSGGKVTVHFMKFCNGVLLYSSENDDRYRERGYYDHGMYPFFTDKLYPVKGSFCGLGVIDMMNGTLRAIDELGTSILENAKMASKRRYFIRADGSINEKEFADFHRSFVHYNGSGDPNSSVMPIEMPYLSETYVNIMNRKIDELKETSGNRDFSQGITTGGVTAAAAIAALQEAGSKTSRDMIGESYRVFEDICSCIIKLIKQFYVLPRCFRIAGNGTEVKFILCKSDEIFKDSDEPMFDIKVSADKKSAFSRAAMNELACEMYRMGMFSPAAADSTAICLSMMEFDGKEEIEEKVRSLAEKYKKMAGGAQDDFGQL